MSSIISSTRGDENVRQCGEGRWYGNAKGPLLKGRLEYMLVCFVSQDRLGAGRTEGSQSNACNLDKLTYIFPRLC